MAKVLNASTDGTLGGLNASNDIVVGQKAIKEYVDSKNLGVLSDTEGNILVGAVGSTILTIDAALSTTSTNPVQNKVINTALGNKLNTDTSNLTSTGKANITSLSAPSVSRTTLTLDSNNSAVAPADGWVTISIQYPDNKVNTICFCGLYVEGVCFIGHQVQYSSGGINNAYSMPVHAGETFSVGLSGYTVSDINSITFWYAQGVAP